MIDVSQGDSPLIIDPKDNCKRTALLIDAGDNCNTKVIELVLRILEKTTVNRLDYVVL